MPGILLLIQCPSSILPCYNIINNNQDTITDWYDFGAGHDLSPGACSYKSYNTIQFATPQIDSVSVVNFTMFYIIYYNQEHA
jgi:hypothetical protein